SPAGLKGLPIRIEPTEYSSTISRMRSRSSSIRVRSSVASPCAVIPNASDTAKPIRFVPKSMARILCVTVLAPCSVSTALAGCSPAVNAAPPLIIHPPRGREPARAVPALNPPPRSSGHGLAGCQAAGRDETVAAPHDDWISERGNLFSGRYGDLDGLAELGGFNLAWKVKDKRPLDAVEVFRAVQAVAPDLHSKGLTGSFGKTQLAEEPRRRGQGKYLLEAALFGLVQQTLDDGAAHPLTLDFRRNAKGANFRQFRAVEFQSAATHEDAVLLGHRKLPDVFIELGRGTRQHDLLVHIVVN